MTGQTSNINQTKYSSYKETGIEWLKEIPQHWELKRLKDISSVNSEVIPENTSPDYLIQYLDIGNVDDIGGIGINQELYFKNAPSRARRRVRDGDTIVSTVRTYLKAIAYFEKPPDNQIVSTGFAVIHPSKSIYPKFLMWLVLSPEFINRVVAYSVGVSYPAINPSELLCLPVWLPPHSEQQTIANFLDRETTRIDALISKYQHMLELLDEKRCSLINQVVINGLDKSAQMKDSEVESIGLIPENWQLSKLKHISTVSFSNVDKKSYEGETEVLLCNYIDVYKNETITSDINFMKSTASQNEIEKFKLENGDVIITKDSESWNDICIPAYLPEPIANLVCGYHLAIIRPNQGIVYGAYLHRLLQSRAINYHSEIEATGVTRYGIDYYAIGNMPVLVPPCPDQIEIAKFLELQTKEIQKSKALIINLIRLLMEYRTSLISGVVTGKIDVRSLLMEES